MLFHYIEVKEFNLFAYIVDIFRKFGCFDVCFFFSDDWFPNVMS